MRKKIIIGTAVVILVVLGVLTACLYYNSKYVKFQDKLYISF